MENHYRELLRFLSARLGDRQAAADVAHDAYLRVLERSSQARIEHPRAFLYRTALNLAVDEHRRSRVRKAEPLHVLDEEEGMSEPSPQVLEDQRQRLDLLTLALNELPPLCRESFLLRKLEGLSHNEIAAHLNISRSLVEKHIVNAMRHCRLRMQACESS